MQDAGFLVLRGNLFDSAIMKTSVISHGVPRALSLEPRGPGGLRGPRRGVRRAGGLSRAASTIRRSASTSTRMLFMRGAGPIGYPGAAEVVNMRPPAYLHQARASLRCPASATAASRAPRARPRSSTPRRKRPRAAALPCCRPATGCASISTRATANMLISDEELAKRRAELEAPGGYQYPAAARRPGRKSSAAWSASWRTAWC